MGLNERPVFLLGTSHRCGSTFLQRLVNSTGEVFLWRENGGALDMMVSLRNQLEAWGPINDKQWELREADGHGAWVANLNPRAHCLL